MKTKFLIILEKGERNYSASSPVVPGCVATGKSVETTLNEMREALVFHIEGLIENGADVPTPKTLNYYIEKTDEISSDDILAHIEIEVPQPAFA
jgi:predicted RNase H-like HicB family nuclease